MSAILFEDRAHPVAPAFWRINLQNPGLTNLLGEDYPPTSRVDYMKLWGKVLIGVVAAIILAAIAVPLFVNANTFRPMLENQLSTALGRQIKLGDLSLSLFSGQMVAKDISISDDPAYSPTPFLEASSLHIGVEMKPLIFDHALRVTSLKVDRPRIHIVHAANGTFNFSSIAKSQANQDKSAQAQRESAFPDLKVGLLKIIDGVATVDSLPRERGPLVYDKVNLQVEKFSFLSAFPFVLTANLPGGGDLSVKGTAGPIDSNDAANSPFTADLNVKHLDPVAGGFVSPNQGFSMLADIVAHATSNGRDLSSTGSIHSDKLKLVKNGTPAPRPMDLTYDVVHDLAHRTGQVKDLTLKTGNVGAHGNGTYNLTPAGASVDMRLAGESLPIDQLEQLLPALGIQLPSNSTLKGGTLTVHLTARGPADNLVVEGPVEINNTRMAGFNLGSNLSGLAMLAGVKTGNDTEIRQVRFDLRYTTSGIRTDNVYALVPALGQATGAGSISDSGALNYRLIVKLATNQGMGGMAMTGIGMIGGGVGNMATSTAKNGIPLVIGGTTSHPVFSADMKSIGGNLLQDQATSILNQRLQKNNAPNPVSGVLGRLFGKKQ